MIRSEIIIGRSASTISPSSSSSRKRRGYDSDDSETTTAKTPAVEHLNWLLQRLEQQQQTSIAVIKSIVQTAVQQALPACPIRSRVLAALSSSSFLSSSSSPSYHTTTSTMSMRNATRLARNLHRAFHQDTSLYFFDTTSITKKQPLQQQQLQKKFTGYRLFLEEHSKALQKRNAAESGSSRTNVPARTTTLPQMTVASAFRAWNRLSDRDKSYYERRARRSGIMAALYNNNSSLQQKPFFQTVLEGGADCSSSAAAAVSSSDSSSDTETDESVSSLVKKQDPEITACDYWGYFMEALQLEIVCRQQQQQQPQVIEPGKKGKIKGSNFVGSPSFCRIFQVYRLVGEAQVVAPFASVTATSTIHHNNKNNSNHHQHMRTVRRRIEDEFLSLYEGTVDTRARRARMVRDCRVYVSQPPPPPPPSPSNAAGKNNGENRHHTNILWVQINLGRCFFGSQEHQQQTKRKMTTNSSNKVYGAEYHVVLVQDESHIAISCAGPAAKPRLTRLVLSALEAALFTTSATTFNHNLYHHGAGGANYYSDDHNVKDHGIVLGLTGLDPLDLLRSASAAHGKTAIGRFAMYAARKGGSGSKGSLVSDPVSAFESAATASLLKMTLEEEDNFVVERDGYDYGNSIQLQKQPPHSSYKGSRSLQELCRQVSASSGGKSRVVGVAVAGTRKSSLSRVLGGVGGIILDHSAGERRQRKRRSEADLGRPQDCPKRSRVRWDVTSNESTAAASAWGDNNNNINPNLNNNKKKEIVGQQQDLPSLLVSKFKCRVVLKGSDVFAGLRALVDAGVTTGGSLPDCVRDAPSLGGSIRVIDGAFVSAKKKTKWL